VVDGQSSNNKQRIKKKCEDGIFIDLHLDSSPESFRFIYPPHFQINLCRKIIPFKDVKVLFADQDMVNN
jgi:hypothetical protein